MQLVLALQSCQSMEGAQRFISPGMSLLVLGMAAERRAVPQEETPVVSLAAGEGAPQESCAAAQHRSSPSGH